MVGVKNVHAVIETGAVPLPALFAKLFFNGPIVSFE